MAIVVCHPLLSPLKLDAITAMMIPPYATSLIFIPFPVGIHVAVNAFVRLHDDFVVSIVELNPEQWQMKVQHFLSHQQLLQHVSIIINGNEISFFPEQTHFPPFYVCDSDITSHIDEHSIAGLAFIFHVDDPLVSESIGFAHTYRVPSCFKTLMMIIEHEGTFKCFPSMAFPVVNLIIKML
jgi:hypothetical protein